MSAAEVRICPILMKTVLWNENGCTETCQEECPIEAFEPEDNGSRDKVKEKPMGAQK